MINVGSKRRLISVVSVVILLLALLGYVAFNSGPLAPIKVVTGKVQHKAINPQIFGIGTVEARHTYKIGHNYTARVKALHFDVGDYVAEGETLAEMEPVDLDERILSRYAALKSSEASVLEAEAKLNFAKSQSERYERLFEVNAVSEDDLSIKRQSMQVAFATLQRSKEEYARAKADYDALVSQRDELILASPANGIVIERNSEVGSTILSGQTLFEIIDPSSIWVNVRFDQISSNGLETGLLGQVTLRSQQDKAYDAIVSRIEIKADAVTEETLAKVVILNEVTKLPRIGELAEVTVNLPKLPPELVIPNASLRRFNESLGVWRITKDMKPEFVPVSLGRADLDGNVQVLDGLNLDDEIVLYSEAPISPYSAIQVVESNNGLRQ